MKRIILRDITSVSLLLVVLLLASCSTDKLSNNASVNTKERLPMAVNTNKKTGSIVTDTKIVPRTFGKNEVNNRGIINNYKPWNSILNIVHITDMHINCTNTKDNELTDVINTINAIYPRPQLLVSGGDLVDWNNSNYWTDYISIMGNLNGSITQEHVVGNHDIRGQFIWLHSYSGYDTYIGSSHDRARSMGDYGIIIMDSNDKTPVENDYSGDLTGSQLSWFETQINNFSSKRQIVVFMHHPVYAARSDWYLGEDPIISDEESNRYRFINDCQANDAGGNDKVSLVVSGHVHRDAVFIGLEDQNSYSREGTELNLGDAGYYDNEFSKQTHYIVTTTSQNRVYRMIQLDGEMAVYRTYSYTVSDPLPPKCETGWTGKSGSWTYVLVLVKGGHSGVKDVSGYWFSSSQWYWHFENANYWGSNSSGDWYYFWVPPQNSGDHIYYKAAVENNDKFITDSQLYSCIQ